MVAKVSGGVAKCMGNNNNNNDNNTLITRIFIDETPVYRCAKESLSGEAS